MLNYQTIDIPFGNSLRLDVDPKLLNKLLPSGSLLTLENGYRKRTGEIQKRYGLTALATDVLEDTDNLSGPLISVFRHNSELLILDDSEDIGPSRLYTYSSNLGKWSDKGFCPSYRLTADPVGSDINGEDTAYLDSCGFTYGGNDYIAITYKSNSTSIRRVAIIDAATKAVISEHQITSSTIFAHIVAIPGDDKVGVAYHGSGSFTLQYTYYDFTTETWTNVANINTDLDNAGTDTQLLKVIPYSTDEFIVAYRQQTSGDIVVRRKDSVGSTNATYTNDSYTPEVFGLAASGTDVYLTFFDSSNGTYCIGLDGDDMTENFAAVQLDSEKTTPTITIASVADSEQCNIFYEVWDSGAKTRIYKKIRKVVIDDEGSITTAKADFLYQLGLASRPMQRNWDATSSSYLETYFWASYHNGVNLYDATQATLFLINQDGNIVDRALVGEHFGDLGDVTPSHNIPLFAELSDDKWVTVTIRSGDVKAEDASTHHGSVVLLTSDFSATSRYNPRTVSYNGSILTTGSKLTAFDGKQVFSPGFEIYPTTPTVSLISGGSVDTGNHIICAIYEWVDNNGNIYRSAASSSVTQNVTSGKYPRIQVPNIRIGDIDLDEIRIIVYMTTVDGTIFYRAGEADNRSDFEGTPIDVTDSDADLQTHETLYTESGELANILPPSPHTIAVEDDKLFLVPADNRKKIWEGKPSGGSIEFNDTMIKSSPDDEDIVELVCMDGKKIIFKENSISYFAGTGADITGSGSFTQTRVITRNMGCTDRRSVAVMKDGVVFKSQHGIYLLDRGLTLHYISKPVQGIEPTTIYGTTVDGTEGKVYFHGDSYTLVWDYVDNNWSKYTEQYESVVGSTIWDDKLTCIEDSTDTVVYEDTTTFTDGSGEFDMKIKTPWINLAGLSGYKRIRRYSIIGDYRTANTCTVNVYTDYDESTVVQALTHSVDDKPVPKRLRKQKCNAIQFEISDTTQAGTKESMSLTGISLEYGVRKTLNKTKV